MFNLGLVNAQPPQGRRASRMKSVASAAIAVHDYQPQELLDAEKAFLKVSLENELPGENEYKLEKYNERVRRDFLDTRQEHYSKRVFEIDAGDSTEKAQPELLVVKSLCADKVSQLSVVYVENIIEIFKKMKSSVVQQNNLLQIKHIYAFTHLSKQSNNKLHMFNIIMEKGNLMKDFLFQNNYTDSELIRIIRELVHTLQGLDHSARKPLSPDNLYFTNEGTKIKVSSTANSHRFFSAASQLSQLQAEEEYSSPASSTTNPFASPENHRYPQKITPKGDVFSIGVLILYLSMHTQNELKGNEWVRNKLNQSNETLTQTLDKFPSSSQLKYLLYRSLEWDEENRCTMEELLEYLKSAESVGAKRRGSIQKKDDQLGALTKARASIQVKNAPAVAVSNLLELNEQPMKKVDNQPVAKSEAPESLVQLPVKDIQHYIAKRFKKANEAKIVLVAPVQSAISLQKISERLSLKQGAQGETAAPPQSQLPPLPMQQPLPPLPPVPPGTSAPPPNFEPRSSTSRRRTVKMSNAFEFGAQPEEEDRDYSSMIWLSQEDELLEHDHQKHIIKHDHDDSIENFDRIWRTRDTTVHTDIKSPLEKSPQKHEPKSQPIQIIDQQIKAPATNAEETQKQAVPRAAFFKEETMYMYPIMRGQTQSNTVVLNTKTLKEYTVKQFEKREEFNREAESQENIVKRGLEDCFTRLVERDPYVRRFVFERGDCDLKTFRKVRLFAGEKLSSEEVLTVMNRLREIAYLLRERAALALPKIDMRNVIVRREKAKGKDIPAVPIRYELVLGEMSCTSYTSTSDEDEKRLITAIAMHLLAEPKEPAVNKSKAPSQMPVLRANLSQQLQPQQPQSVPQLQTVLPVVTQQQNQTVPSVSSQQPKQQAQNNSSSENIAQLVEELWSRTQSYLDIRTQALNKHLQNGGNEAVLQATAFTLLDARNLLRSYHTTVAQARKLENLADDELQCAQDFYDKNGLGSRENQILVTLLQRHQENIDRLRELHVYRRLGELYAQEGDTKTALEYYDRAIDGLKEDDILEYAQILESIGLIHCGEARYQDAWESFHKALQVFIQEYGADHLAVGKTLNNIGLAYHYAGILDKALENYQRCLAIEEKHLGATNIEVAKTLNNIGLVHHDRGEYESAIQQYLRCLEINERAQGKNNLEVAAILQNIAAVYDDMGQFDKSYENYQRALDIRCKYYYGSTAPPPTILLPLLLSEDSEDFIGLVQSIGSVLAQAGRYAEALQYLHPLASARSQEDGQEIQTQAQARRKEPSSSAIAQIAEIYAAQGRYAEALQLYEQVLQAERTRYGAQHLEVARTLNSIGLVQSCQGRQAAALLTLQQALDVKSALHGVDHEDTARTLLNMAHVLRHQGRYSAAHKYYNKALEIFTELSGRQTLSVAVCLKHLGIVSCLLGFYEEARTRLEEAQKIVSKLMGEESLEEARLKLSQAVLENYAGHYTKAKELIEKAREIKLKTLRPQSFELIAGEEILAATLRRLGQLDEALERYRSCYAAKAKALPATHIELAKSLHNIGSILYQKGDYQTALSTLKQALAIKEKFIETNFVVVAEDYVRPPNEATVVEEQKEVVPKKLEAPEHVIIAPTLMSIGACLRALGDFAASEPYLVRATDIFQQHYGEDHVQVGQCQEILGNIYEELCKFEDAIKCFMRAVKFKEREYGSMHPEVGKTLANVALVFWNQGKYDYAINNLQKSLFINESSLGANDIALVPSLENMGILKTVTRQYDDAIDNFERALALKRAFYGDNDKHIEVARTKLNLAVARTQLHEFEEATRLFAEVAPVYEKHYSINSIQMAKLIEYRAGLACDQGNFDEALRLYQQCLEILRRVFPKEVEEGAENAYFGRVYFQLALLFSKRDAKEQAIQYFDLAIKIFRTHYTEENELYKLAVKYRHQKN